MLQITDRICGWLLVLATCGHVAGTFVAYRAMSSIFVWSLGSALAGLLLGALNIVRAGRPHDKTLAVIATLGTACWALVAFGYGKSIGNVLDPRPVTHIVVATALVFFGVRTLRGGSAEEIAR